MRFEIRDAFGAPIGSVTVPEDNTILFNVGDRVTIPTPNVRAPWYMEVME